MRLLYLIVLGNVASLVSFSALWAIDRSGRMAERYGARFVGAVAALACTAFPLMAAALSCAHYFLGRDRSKLPNAKVPGGWSWSVWIGSGVFIYNGAVLAIWSRVSILSVFSALGAAAIGAAVCQSPPRFARSAASACLVSSLALPSLFLLLVNARLLPTNHSAADTVLASLIVVQWCGVFLGAVALGGVGGRGAGKTLATAIAGMVIGIPLSIYMLYGLTVVGIWR